MPANRPDTENLPAPAHERWDSILAASLLIRRAEERLLDLFAQGSLNGTVHCCVGQELIAAGVAAFLRPDDTVVSGHRCHGHFLAFTGRVESLFAEVMGLRAGASRGLGGSQHLHHEGFYSGGILGGLIPVAAGRAMAQARDGSDRIAVAFVGDGAFGEGVLYETFNLASLWRLPLLFVIEDNGVAQSTPTSTTTAGRLDGRAEAFGIPVLSADCWDPQALILACEQAVGRVRGGGGPVALHVRTYRLVPHSKGDDHRDAEEIASYRARDVLQRLLDSGSPRAVECDRQAREAVDAAVAAARTSLPLTMGDLLAPTTVLEPAWKPAAADGRRYLTALQECLRHSLSGDPRLLCLGEDLQDPYGGAFKATAGLSTLFPGRVANTPISEAAIVGLGSGLALGGYRVIIEIMFGDFVTLAADQLINQAAKLWSVYGAGGGGRLIVRTPMGGHRGYGPTHSQSLERHLFGVPGLRVVALNSMVDPALVFGELLGGGTAEPAVVIENKLLYGRRIGDGLPEGFSAYVSTESLPTVHVTPGASAEVTLIGYGGMLDDLLTAADRLFAEHDVLAQVLCPTRLYPFDIRGLLPMMDGSRAVVVAEEGQGFAGFGAEVLAQLTEHAPGRFGKLARVSAAPVPIPASRLLEAAVLPSAATVVQTVLEALSGR